MTTLDVSDDFGVFDNTDASATFSKLNPDQKTFATPIPITILAMQEQNDVVGDLAVIRQTIHVQGKGLPAGMLIGQTDRITRGDGVTLVVEHADFQVWGTSWACQCWRRRTGS